MPECYLGEIRSFALQLIPRNWMPCDGRILRAHEYQALYSLLGDRFGGDGRSTFALPDLRGRVVRGSRPPPKGVRVMSGGSETIVLTQNQLPSHQHSFGVATKIGTVSNVVNAIYAEVAEPPKPPAVPAGSTTDLYAVPVRGRTVTIDASSLTSAGDGTPHSNMQPFGVVQYCICVNGNYPPTG